MCARKMKVRKIVVEKDRAPAKQGENVPKSTDARAPKQCATCHYWIGSTNCRAFPDGIPWAILNGKRDHVRPHPEDRGIQYRRAQRETEEES